MWAKSGVPGPTKLIGGNLQAGFYGEVPAKDFVTGDELARRIGLTAGKSQYSDEPWLKFSYLGKIEFMAKKPFRYDISWDSIKSANAVYGDRVINIDGNNFKIRLIKGKTEGQQGNSSQVDGIINRGSEWNKLLLPTHINAPSNWAYKDNVNYPTENWNIGYTDADLVVGYYYYGGWSWCQEYGSSSSSRLLRGIYGISDSGQYTSSRYDSYVSWRPVLELVE